MNPSVLLPALVALCASHFAPPSAGAATLTVLPVVPNYRSLADSPWQTAVVAGDAIKYADRFCDLPAPTLPDGFGVNDDFEDDECISPWLNIVQGRVRDGGSVDADDGLPIPSPSGRSFVQAFATGGGFIAELDFITTTDNKLPLWLGFAITGIISQPGPVFMDLLGIQGSLLSTINLSVLVGEETRDPRVVEDDVFVGFISDTPIESFVIRGLGSIGIDHIQYGYGARPIPEPGAPLFALTLGGWWMLLHRRRSER